jgi:hypothetical protein
MSSTAAVEKKPDMEQAAEELAKMSLKPKPAEGGENKENDEVG